MASRGEQHNEGKNTGCIFWWRGKNGYQMRVQRKYFMFAGKHSTDESVQERPAKQYVNYDFKNNCDQTVI